MRGFPSRFHGPLSSLSASVWSLVLSAVVVAGVVSLS